LLQLTAKRSWRKAVVAAQQPAGFGEPSLMAIAGKLPRSSAAVTAMPA